jgi:hypothetical protein
MSDLFMSGGGKEVKRANNYFSISQPRTVADRPGSPVAQICSNRITKGRAELRLLDRKRGPRLVDVKAMQEVPAIGDQERIHGHSRFRPGAVDRDRVRVQLQKIEQARARDLEPPRIVDDDVETRLPIPAQERVQLGRARGRLPAALREIDIEHLQALACDVDDLVDRSGLLGDRGKDRRRGARKEAAAQPG